MASRNKVAVGVLGKRFENLCEKFMFSARKISRTREWKEYPIKIFKDLILLSF